MKAYGAIYAGKKVVITGAGGYVGSLLALSLLDEGAVQIRRLDIHFPQPSPMWQKQLQETGQP